MEDRPSLESAFGPGFFQTQLNVLVRDRCPQPGEMLPSVTIRLIDGESLDVCYLIALTPKWLAVAVAGDSPGPVRTELVPYAGIFRITIRPVIAAGHQIGFQSRAAIWLAKDGDSVPEPGTGVTSDSDAKERGTVP